jgi:hypothetical protein
MVILQGTQGSFLPHCSHLGVPQSFEQGAGKWEKNNASASIFHQI